MVLIGSHLFKIVFLGFLISWKHTLAGCAEDREPAGT